MPKKQITTQSDINCALEMILQILRNIRIEEVESIVESAVEGRYRENDLDVDISESDSEEDPDRDDTWSENGSTTSEEYPSPQAL